MSIAVLSSPEIERMRAAGAAAAHTLELVGRSLRPGMSTADVDRIVRRDTMRQGATPSQLGYRGFPAAVCTSRNDVVCHGIPREDEVLVLGDIVNVDITSCLEGFHGDTSRTFMIGQVSAEAKHVVSVAKECLRVGIAEVRAGVRLGDIAAAVSACARGRGCSVVREYGGHGIGRSMHSDPHVPFVGRAGTGLRLKAGMAITIEPMVNQGGAAVVQAADGWTVKTADGCYSAQFEHTIVVTNNGCEIMTGKVDGC